MEGSSSERNFISLTLKCQVESWIVKQVLVYKVDQVNKTDAIKLYRCKRDKMLILTKKFSFLKGLYHA